MISNIQSFKNIMVKSHYLSILRKSSNYSLKDIKVYNSLSKKKESLSLKHGNNLIWYSCGPTVYDSAHIGHASSYVNFDIIKRILTNYFRVNVTNLMNITDVDDKIIDKANQENKTISQVSKFYEKEFLEDLNKLNCERPSIILRVTEHVPQIITFIQKLINAEQAYKTKSGSVYFRTQKFSVKSFFDLQDSTTTEGVDNEEKEHVFDFALWKATKKESEPGWESPWGIGRPGWHIVRMFLKLFINNESEQKKHMFLTIKECSALASIAFGQHLDFHSGGKDLVFPHHHNELTQCCAYYNTEQWASYWLHTGHLHLSDDIKMSKSLKNTLSIGNLLKKYSSNQFRFLCLLTPYRNNIEFSDTNMQKPINLLKSFESFTKLCRTYCNEEIPMLKLNLDESVIYEKLSQAQANVHKALCDDFNTSQAIEQLSDLIYIINKQFQLLNDPKLIECQNNDPNDMNCHYGCVMSVCNYIESTLDLFGIKLNSNKNISQNEDSSLNINAIIDNSLEFRKSMRLIALNKNIGITKEAKQDILNACDQLRNGLREQNIEFKDLKGETIWQINK